MQPYYMLMKLPGEKQSEFIQMLPFTPRLKNNMSAWMVARSDGAHYGHLLVYQFPKQKIVFGPQQIEARINQDQVISPQVTLWNQMGSEVSWGTLLVIPIEESLLYVQPLYLKSEKGIPELKRVVVAYKNDIIMAETLRAALISIFGDSIASALPSDRFDSTATSVVEATSTTAPVVSSAAAQPTSLSGLAIEAQQLYDEMIKAQRDGDWALYGEDQKKLGEVLAKMSKGKTPGN